MNELELVKKAYEAAKTQYAALGIDTDRALDKMKDIVISVHCWQTDDVGGFETPDSSLGGGGIQVTGNYPGKARSIAEMRADLDKVFELLPGKQRLNLHAIYGEFGGQKVDRDQIEVKHFEGWIEWAQKYQTGLDFNATCFSHPLADDGFTLSSKNEKVRKFWVDHVKACRKIAAEFGKRLGTPSVHNLWIPDGSKDNPIDRAGHRAILKKSLDEIFSVEYPKEHLKDAMECKLFGIGSEAMVVGSHEFYLGYTISNNKLLCLDNGHFHPTEQVGDKISAVLQFLDEILLHVTRGVRWDSDHIVSLNDEVLQIAQEIVRNNYQSRVNIGLDFFDGSVNRVGAYLVGTRATQQAFLQALLEPTAMLKELEEKDRNFERLAWLETMKSRPFGAVWDYYCLLNQVPTGGDFIKEVVRYEEEVLLKR
ncbi:L-rhamnose isomerase [Marinilabilia salmonicolor]|uniref:L-rhamnose isomerase n=1 Tax=Marinilabilia salmonicolor TaxID=989 RepID=A0A368V0I9_9BACT|nr:L-rhamnose isomerase [Marinilabilia salmonicolor]RCW32521.1 L-rhamnose isomerase [Marinilabilia salmonicolor]